MHLLFQNSSAGQVTMSEDEMVYHGKRDITRALLDRSPKLSSNTVVVVQTASPALDTDVERLTRDFVIECGVRNAHIVFVTLAPDDRNSLAILHSACRCDNPYDLSSTSFFVDNTPCGNGSAGLEKALQVLLERRSKFLIDIGNLCSPDWGAAGHCPWGPREDDVMQVLRQNGIQFIGVTEPSFQGWKEFWENRKAQIRKRYFLITIGYGVGLCAIIAGVFFFFIRRHLRVKASRLTSAQCTNGH